jgi:hypothetical protein
MAAVVISPNGDITVDGKTVTPAQAATEAGVAIADIHKIITALSNRKNITWKNAEKAVIYLAGIVGASNGFTWLTMPNSVREWLVGGAAFVLAAIHISTPTTPTA